MSDIYISLGGGGGISSDEVTATSSHVLQGQTYVGVDTDDEIGIGTMPNNPAQNVSLNCGESVTIPLGYNPGSTITANSLASQTGGATADDSKVLSSYTYWKDGVKRTGNLAVSSVVSFNVAQYSNLTLIASWAKPSKGPWSGLRVVCKQGGYPSHASDGTLFYEGSGTAATKSLAAGTWYFRAWNYMTTSAGRLYGNYVDKTATNNQIRGQQTFTSSGVFTIPSNVYSIDIFCVGGGAGGGNGNYVEGVGYSGAGGGSGYTATRRALAVSPGQQYSVTIGSGGLHGSRNQAGTTSFGNIVQAAGGLGAGYVQWGTTPTPTGGSGGGSNLEHKYVSSTGHRAGNGGADGSDGAGYNKGSGQGSTTRAFGEASNTLYAGGGGGGGQCQYGYSEILDHYWQAYGGSGGGGAGGYFRDGFRGDTKRVLGTPGAANTGSGGGGGACAGSGSSPNYYGDGADGGSGICLIRWGY